MLWHFQMPTLVLELVLSFLMELRALVVRRCSHLVPVLLVSPVLLVTMKMLVSDVKVRILLIQPSCYTTMFLNIFITVDSVGSTCTYGDVRLVDGSNQYEGRVELCINDQWGTVCDNSWGSTDATTVCKQLGYAYTSGMVKLYPLIS